MSTGVHAADAALLSVDGAAMPVKQQAGQGCSAGQPFSASVAASLGYSNNTRPPAETIRPNNGQGPGGSGPGGGGPGIIQQTLAETSQSDSYLNANASIMHGACLSSTADDIAMLWVNRAGFEDNRYFKLDGVDEQGIILTTALNITGNRSWRVTPALTYETSTLEGAQYLQRVAIGSKQSWNLTQNWQLGFSVSSGRLEFDQVPDTLHVEGDDRSVSAETSIILSPLYRVKLGVSRFDQSTDDVKLNYDSHAFQLEISRWHSMSCDAYLRYRIESLDYDLVTTTGDVRKDDESRIEFGACAVLSAHWKANASMQKEISDSNVAEFDYDRSSIELSLQYRF